MVTLTFGHKDYTCKMSARIMVELEDKLGKNPLEVFVGGLPKMSDCLSVFAKSAGISEEEAFTAYDAFISDGGSMPDFISEVMKIYKDAGFFKEPKEDGKEEKN